MNLEQAKKLSIDAIKKLWDNNYRFVSVKRIREVQGAQSDLHTNLMLGRALQKISLNSDLLQLHAKSPNKYKITKSPRSQAGHSSLR